MDALSDPSLYTACRFPLNEANHCAFHPNQPEFLTDQGENTGSYPCCQAPAMRFNTGFNSRLAGCQAKPHTVGNYGVGAGNAALSHQESALQIQAKRAPFPRLCHVCTTPAV